MIKAERAHFFGTFRGGDLPAPAGGIIADMRALLSVLLVLSAAIPLPSESAGFYYRETQGDHHSPKDPPG
jgi:hypothetical protein